MKPVLFVIALVLSLVIADNSFADAPFQDVQQEAITIIRTRYPDGEFRKDKDWPDMYVFSRNMREFVIYRLNKIGDWQKPMTVQGPDRGGLSVRFYVRKGKWEGALAIPYAGTKDLNVFRETHVVRNSKDGEWHIWAEILTPPIDAPEEVKKNLVKLFNEFGR